MNRMIISITLTLLCILTITAGGKSRNRELLDKLDRVLEASVYKRITNVFLKADKSVECVDDDPANMCPLWKKYGVCTATHIKWMRKYCAKTCKFCTPPAPPIPDIPQCAYKDFGCCWDNVTEAKGPVEGGIQVSQCAPCMNMQSDRFCEGWKDKCNSLIKGQGDVMKLKCPITCQVPCNYNLNTHKDKCQDHKGFKQNCLQWFDEGKCKTDQNQMRVYCPFTCGFCTTQYIGFQSS